MHRFRSYLKFDNNGWILIVISLKTNYEQTLLLSRDRWLVGCLGGRWWLSSSLTTPCSPQPTPPPLPQFPFGHGPLTYAFWHRRIFSSSFFLSVHSPLWLKSLPWSSKPSLEARILAWRLKPRAPNSNTSLESQIPASRLKFQPRGSNPSLEVPISALSLQSQPWASNPSLMAPIPASWLQS